MVDALDEHAITELTVHKDNTRSGYSSVPDPSDEHHFLVEGFQPPRGFGNRTCVCGWTLKSGCGMCLNQAFVNHVDRERARRADKANTYVEGY